MAKLLDLLVAAEGFVPVAGRVYAQDGDGFVQGYDPNMGGPELYNGAVWLVGGASRIGDTDYVDAPLSDDHTTAVITAEAIMEARGEV